MIDEPEQKATLRAYLALLTGRTVYTNTRSKEASLTIYNANELNLIKEKLLTLGCKEGPKALYYDGEVVVNTEKTNPVVVQLYKHSNPLGEEI